MLRVELLAAENGIAISSTAKRRSRARIVIDGAPGPFGRGRPPSTLCRCLRGSRPTNGMLSSSGEARAPSSQCLLLCLANFRVPLRAGFAPMRSIIWTAPFRGIRGLSDLGDRTG